MRTSPFLRGGRRRLGVACAVAAVLALAAVGTEPATAAVPDHYGFVLWNGSATVASGTTPAATTVSVNVPGRYKVIFPGQAASGGVAHVTAINPVAHWCQVTSIAVAGGDEVVGVNCYKVGGSLDASAFSAIFDSSSGTATGGGRFGYVDAQPSGSLVSQYNSAGATNVVTPGGTGIWTVTFPGLTTPGPVDGSLQATAVNPDLPARCKVAGWSLSGGAQVAKVYCFGADGTPVNTRFTLTYQYQRALYGSVAPPKYFGYLYNVPPTGPVSTNFNYPAGPGANTASSSGTGLTLVRFPLLAVLPDDVQVTAVGTGPEFCGLSAIWTHSGSDTIAQNVNCWTNAGAPATSGFLISDNSQN